MNELVHSRNQQMNALLEKKLSEAQPFIELMSEYECALMEVETKLNVLNTAFSIKKSRNPFESIKSRIKSPMSIIKKMQRLNIEPNIENIVNNLNDIAGIRVICSFVDDIYFLADALIQQDDIRLIEKKDYIKSPKENGYRSLHLIIEVPIFLPNGKKYKRVEVQFRTIAMDFWASLEHKLKYKKVVKEAENISLELKQVAEIINAADIQMKIIRDQIEKLNKEEER